MPASMSNVRLFVHDSNVSPLTALETTEGITVIDLTSSLGTDGWCPYTYAYTSQYQQKYFFTVLTDVQGNETRASLGAHRTQDNKPPTITSFTASNNGTSPCSVADVSYAFDDTSLLIGDAWVHCSLSNGLTAATVKSSGSNVTTSDGVTGQKAGTVSYSNLVPGTTYYFYAVAKDAAGNDSTMSTATLATLSDNTPPVLDSFTLVADATYPATKVVVTLNVHDPEAHTA